MQILCVRNLHVYEKIYFIEFSTTRKSQQFASLKHAKDPFNFVLSIIEEYIYFKLSIAMERRERDFTLTLKVPGSIL